MAAKLLMRINQKIVRKKRALEALQNSNVMALEDTGMNAEALVLEQMPRCAFKYARRNANAEELPGLNALKDIHAD